jgi:hypothetical protein
MSSRPAPFTLNYFRAVAGASARPQLAAFLRRRKIARTGLRKTILFVFLASTLNSAAYSGVAEAAQLSYHELKEKLSSKDVGSRIAARRSFFEEG